MPSVLCDVGIRFDEHTELQVLSFVHLNGETLVGQVGGELGQQPDVGLVCGERSKQRRLVNV